MKKEVLELLIKTDKEVLKTKENWMQGYFFKGDEEGDFDNNFQNFKNSGCYCIIGALCIASGNTYIHGLA